MQFNKYTFCPNVVDKSTTIKKYLHCSKINSLCKMVNYSPSGQMIPIQDVKNLGCPYGYVIQGIEKKEKENTVEKDDNILHDISKEEFVEAHKIENVETLECDVEESNLETNVVVEKIESNKMVVEKKTAQKNKGKSQKKKTKKKSNSSN